MQKTKNKSTNKFISLIFVLLCTIILAGCASVDYSRFVYPDGTVSDRIVVEISDEAFNHCNITKANLYQEIVRDLDNNYLLPIRTFRDSYLPVRTAEMTDIEYLEAIDKVRNGIICDVRLVGEQIICDVTFASSEVFNIYYSSINSSSDSTETEEENNGIEFRESTFFDSYVQSSENAFAVLKTDYLKQFINKYKAYFSGEYDFNDLTLTQEYASPNVDIYSNATETETVQGIKMHHWEIDPNNLDFKLEFYTVTPHTSSWYILGLVITFMVTFFVWGYIRRKKQAEAENQPPDFPIELK
ncbi:MAG: hypothetical protein IJE91_00745 [Clostridia bacterium]|nr:hypothetical protein [Clostridia bacterium]